MAIDYLDKTGAQHRAEKTKEWADARFVRYTTYNAVGVAGSGKNVSVLFPKTLYVPDGLIMGGTALSAGLATRGICGVTTPDGKGGCTKENLYLNYDGNNNYSRKVVLGAGSAGNEIANSSGAYTFSAVRGDQMVSYVTNYVPGAIKTWFDSNVHIPSIKTLNTNNSSTLPVSSSEARSGSGSINLHKVSKTGKFSDLNNRGEAFLSWGGQNFAGAYGPIDSAMIADLGANRLAFMPPAGISVEYSRDSGTTWQNYGATDGQKLALTSTGVSFNIGKSDSSNKATEKYMLRISLHTSEGKVYTQLNKFALYVSTNGSNGSYCTIRARTQNNYLDKVEKWDVFANKQSIAGWSGWNIINTSTITTYGNSPANQYGEIQFIFGCTAGSTTYAGLQIQRLMGFGGVGWTTPSNRAKYGTIYKYDYNQNAIFPKDIYVQSGATKEEDRYKVLVTGKTNTFTGTHAFNSGKIYLGQGDNNAIDLRSDGRINSGNSTLVGLVNKAFTLGHSSYETNIRGKATRPKYNGNDLARIIDLPKNYVTTNSEQTISGDKTFSDSIIIPPKNAIMLGTGADGKIYNNSDFYDKKLDGTVLKDMTKANTNGYYCFGYDYKSKLTQSKTLSGFLGHGNAHIKGGRASNNNTTFVGFGKASGYPWFGLTTYNRDYSDGVDAQLVESYGIMIRNGDVAGHSSAYILDGNSSIDTKTRLVTEDELAGKQDALVSGTNIKKVNGSSILGSGNISISADLERGYDYEGFDLGFYNTQYDHKNLLNLASITMQGDRPYQWGTVINVTPKDNSSMVQFYVPDGVGRNGYNHRLLVRSGWGLDSSKMANWQKSAAWEQILTRNTCPKAFANIMTATSTKSAYFRIGDLLVEWGIIVNVSGGDYKNYTVTYPVSFIWYPSVMLQTIDTNSSSSNYSNGAVITSYDSGTSFTFQPRRSENIKVLWIAIGGKTV